MCKAVDLGLNPLFENSSDELSEYYYQYDLDKYAGLIT
jgi:hypothetical protein